MSKIKTTTANIFENYTRARGSNKLKIRNEIVSANLGLVYKMAKVWKGTIEDAEDLIQIGSIALIKAVENFDHTKKFTFSTYACTAIRRSFYHSANNGPINIKRKGIEDGLVIGYDNIDLNSADLKDKFVPEPDLKMDLQDILTEREFNLIQALYYEGKTCTNYGKECKTTKQAVSLRRIRILDKIKERMSGTT